MLKVFLIMLVWISSYGFSAEIKPEKDADWKRRKERADAEYEKRVSEERRRSMRPQPREDVVKKDGKKISCAYMIDAINVEENSKYMIYQCSDKKQTTQKSEKKESTKHAEKCFEHSKSSALGYAGAVVTGPKNPYLAFGMCLEAGNESAKAVNEFGEYWRAKESEREHENIDNHLSREHDAYDSMRGQ
jgi:hypothetical protein